jgi:hypothetical protein
MSPQLTGFARGHGAVAGTLYAQGANSNINSLFAESGGGFDAARPSACCGDTDVRATTGSIKIQASDMFRRRAAGSGDEFTSRRL